MKKGGWPMKEKIKRIIITSILVLPIIFLLGKLLFTKENVLIFKTVFTKDLSNDQIQDMLSEIGWRGYITIAVLSMLQVLVAVLPAEPVQVIAGLTFGLPIGVAACIAGVVAANAIIYFSYKIFGNKLRKYFDSKIDIDFDSIGNNSKAVIVILLLYFLPAIPYGMICFIAANMRMKYPRFLIVTTIGALPSVCIGVGLGHIALESSWMISVGILLVLIVILAVIMIKREYLIDKINEYIHKSKTPYSSKTVVREYSHHRLTIPYIIFRLLTFGKIKLKFTKNVDKVEHPSIVLANHGAFIDFAYAGTLLKKDAPNFIVARMYFYRKIVGNILRSVGCFPKSMFTTDTESAMNCIRVIKRGGVLAMMPEARLSTVGRFEDIQSSTFDFIKKMGVHVYVINIRGDYLAKPKWGHGIRRGSLVEAELNPLFTPDELASLTVAEIESKTLDAMRYDELEWLKTRPEVRYRSKRMAEGLENILTRCPECNGRYTMRTKGSEIFCEKCSLKTKLDQRYLFESDFRFESFPQWYDWQKEKMREEILSDENFTLESEVTLKHSSKDGKTILREAGKGVARLDRTGLYYVGTEDGEDVERFFSMDTIYRVLFGSGENFEVYLGKEIFYFAPTELRSAVDWYIASDLLKGF
jgi:uncharacterized membrane protein YdjX (TVP38/TMEM64 family)